MSNFNFFHNIFHAICILKSSNNHILVVVCSFIEIGTVSKWCIREWVDTPSALKETVNTKKKNSSKFKGRKLSQIHNIPMKCQYISYNKRAKMALDRSPDFLRLLIFFLVAFRKEFTRISLCLYSARSLHSLIPCLLTDQNFKNNSEKGHSRNISMRLFQNLANSFREDFL